MPKPHPSEEISIWAHKKTAEERLQTSPAKKIRPVKNPKPEIDQRVLDHLRSMYSQPNIMPDIETATLWDLTGELKGWMNNPEDSQSWAPFYWDKIKKLIDVAVREHDSEVIDEFLKAWQTLHVKIHRSAKSRNFARQASGATPKGKTGVKRDTEKDQKLARSIASLLPNSVTNSPRSPISCMVLDIIENLQRQYLRAPTGSEIEKASGPYAIGKDHGGITKYEVSAQLKKMDLTHLISRA